MQVSREEAAARISKRVVLGNALLASVGKLKEKATRELGHPTRYDDECREKYDSLSSDYSRWRDFNSELLKRLFDSSEIALEYSGPDVMFAEAATYGVLVAEIQQFEDDLKDDLQKLQSIRERLPLFDETRPLVADQKTASPKDEVIFVVHGRNETILAQTQLLLKTPAIRQVVLRDQVERGSPTLIEKFEHHAKSAKYAVILMTGDDEGRLKNTRKPPRPRARQNVILEFGYFVGALTRDNVCVLCEDGLETPSDIFGLEYVPIDQAGKWKYTVAKKLKSAGFDIDLEKVV